MSQAFTIYCCGTKFHRGSNDVVAGLWKLTQPHLTMINDGPGSGTFKPNVFGGRANPGGASTLGGLLYGVGVDANVEASVRAVAALKPLPRIVNLCGWSRGAVTCAKIANLMYRMGPPLSAIAVNVYAIDPVPGSNAGGGHMWKDIAITPNVRYYHALLSQHDLRGVGDYFQPTYPSVSGPTKVDVDVMPGSHSSICVFDAKGRPQENVELTMDLAKRFLRSHGTQFMQARLFGVEEILTRYAMIQQNFENYTRLKAKTNLDALVRRVKDVNKKDVGGLSMAKPRFFINEHHRETFRLQYPSLTSEIDRDPPQRPFAADTSRRWLAELDRLMASNVEQARAVLLFAALSGQA